METNEEKIIPMGEKYEAKEETRTSATVLFSGGYDSTAVLHKLIVDNKYHTINVIYENIINAADGYKDIGRDKAKVIYNLLNRKAQHNKITLIWKEIDIDSNIIADDGCDSLLLIHLFTILNFGGVVNDVYLSWNKQHIDILNNHKIVNNSKQILDMMHDSILKNTTIHYLEDSFPNCYIELERKAVVLSYLLKNNLFGYCYSYQNLNRGEYNKERKQFLSKQTWFFNDDDKSIETATALVQTGLFNSSDLAKMFSFHTTWAIQDYYNKIIKKRLN